MMNKIKYKSIYSFLLLLLAISSCKVAEPVKLPSISTLPASFNGSADTTSIGYIPWKDFFADQYLISLIDTALKSNLDLQQAIQRIEIARANVLINKGALLPSLDVIARSGVDKFGDYTMNGVGNYDTNLSDNIDQDRRIPTPTPDYFLGLRSSWEIDIWGKLRNRKKAAFTRLLASEKGVRLVKTALVSEVARLYYELLALDNELAIIRKNIELQTTAVELINVQKLAGRVTELAVKQFTAQLLNTKSLEAQVQQQIVRTENQLNLLLGRFPQTISRGEPILEQELPGEVQAGIPSRMLLRRPDVSAAELELLATKADIEAARAAFLPSLTLTPYVGFNSFNAALLFNPGSLAYGILGGLSAPLFNNNKIKAGYRQSVAENRLAYSAYQKALLIGFEEVITSLKSIENFERVAGIKEQEVDVLREGVAISNDLFASGYASYLEVVTAQKSVLEAELQLTTARKAQFLSLIELYRALGGGWE